MAPIPSSLAWSAWQKHLASMKNSPNNARYMEHTSKPLQTNTPSGVLNHRQLVLDKDSPLLQQTLLWPDSNPQKISRLGIRQAEQELAWKDEYGYPQSTWEPIERLAVLKYTVEIIGDAPSDGSGYPVYFGLHGGGGPERSGGKWQSLEGATRTNDGEWRSMSTFYKGSIACGVYITLRGIGDAWDLHFTPAGYVLMERLIENLFLFGAANSGQEWPTDDKLISLVNPDRVYLMGFSAGGDGVFRLAVHMSQRFAASNMGGGDAGDSDLFFENLANSPLCLQVGDQDASGFDRCKSVAVNGTKLDALQNTARTLLATSSAEVYVHDVFIHPTGQVPSGMEDYAWKHNSWENFTISPANTPRTQVSVVRDYDAWQKAYPSSSQVFNWDFTKKPCPLVTDVTKGAYTNPPDWVTNYIRNTTPTLVVWNTTIRAPEGNDCFSAETLASTSCGLAQRRQNYWLEIGNYTSSDVGPLVKARLDKPNNLIFVDQAKTYLRILLRPGMMNLGQILTVKIGGQSLAVFVDSTENATVIEQTLIRNDPNLIFTADIILKQNGASAWTVDKTPMPSSS